MKGQSEQLRVGDEVHYYLNGHYTVGRVTAIDGSTVHVQHTSAMVYGTSLLKRDEVVHVMQVH